MPDVILNLLPVREEEKAAFEAAAPDAVHLYAGRRTATPEQFAQATIVMGWPRAEMLAQAPRLRWFHCMWAGTDQYTDAVPPSVLMTSSAGTNSQSVAEHMLASLLALYRKLPQCRDQQRAHAWVDVGNMKSLVGETVLVIGAGHVGSAFAQLCKALGAECTAAVACEPEGNGVFFPRSAVICGQLSPEQREALLGALEEELDLPRTEVTIEHLETKGGSP